MSESSAKSAVSLKTTLLIGVAIRVLITCTCPRLVSFLQTRVELNTPANSWESIQEGIWLRQHGVDPHKGSVLHTQPLLLSTVDQLNRLTQQTSIDFYLAFLVLCDVITTIAIHSIARVYMTSEKQREQNLQSKKMINHEAFEFLNVQSRDVDSIASFAGLLFTLNPFSVAVTVCRTTLSIELMCYALTMLYILKNRWIHTVCVLSLATYLFFFPIFLWIPVCYTFANKSSSSLAIFCFKSLFCFLCLSVLTLSLLGVSFHICNNDSSFFQSTWGFQVLIPDLQPNVGLYWYFYMEMFDQYHGFFITMVHTLTALTVIPLCWKFPNDEFIPIFSTMMFIGIYKSYPCLGDMSVNLPLLYLLSPSVGQLRNVLLVMLLIMASVPGMPLMYHVWLVTFNPNFFYAMTLVYNTALMLAWSDVVYSHARRTFLLYSGLSYDAGEGDVKKLLMK